MKKCINDEEASKNDHSHIVCVCVFFFFHLEKMKYSYVFVCLSQVGNLLLLVLRDTALNGAQGAQ